MKVISKDNRGLRGDLALALVLALSLRLIYLLARQRAIDMADAIHYIHMARQFAAGDFLNFDENLPLLFSVLGAALHLAVPNWEHAFWIVSLAASTLLVVDERYSVNIVPGLRPLLDPAQAPDTLKLLRDDLSPYEGAKIVVPGIHYLAPEDFPTTSSHMGPDEIRRKKGHSDQ